MSIAITQETMVVPTLSATSVENIFMEIRLALYQPDSSPDKIIPLIRQLGVRIEQGTINHRIIDAYGSLVSLLKEVYLMFPMVGVYDAVLTALLVYLRTDKDSERPCFTEVFQEVFLPYILVALEHGFATLTPDARAATAWNMHTEVMDAVFMGTVGKRNLDTVFNDTVLRTRIFRLFTVVPMIPSASAQFNLFLTATRFYRHARKSNPTVMDELSKLGTLSLDDITGLTQVKDHRSYAYAKLGAIQIQYRQGSLNKYFNRKSLNPVPKKGSSSPSVPPLHWLTLHHTVGGVFTVPITDLYIPDPNATAPPYDDLIFCGYTDSLTISLAGFSAIVLRPLSTYTGPRPTVPVTSVDRSVGRSIIEDVGWNAIDGIDMHEKLLRLIIHCKPNDRANLNNTVSTAYPDRKFAYVFSSLDDLKNAWETIIRLHPSHVTLRRSKGGKKSIAQNNEWVTLSTAADDMAIEGYQLFDTLAATFVEQLTSQPKPVNPGDNVNYSLPNISVVDEDAARITLQADDLLLSSQPHPETLSQTMDRIGSQGPPRCSKSGELRITGANNNLHLENVPSMEQMFSVTASSGPVVTDPSCVRSAPEATKVVPSSIPASAVKAAPVEPIQRSSSASAATKKGSAKDNKTRRTIAVTDDDDDILSVRRATLRERKPVTYVESTTETMDTDDAPAATTLLSSSNDKRDTTQNGKGSAGRGKDKPFVSSTAAAAHKSHDFEFNDVDDNIPLTRTPGNTNVLAALLRKSDTGNVPSANRSSKTKPASSTKSVNGSKTVEPSTVGNSFGVRSRVIPSISKDHPTGFRTDNGSVFDFNEDDDGNNTTNPPPPLTTLSSSKVRSVNKPTPTVSAKQPVIIPELPSSRSKITPKEGTNGKTNTATNVSSKDEFAFDDEDDPVVPQNSIVKGKPPSTGKANDKVPVVPTAPIVHGGTSSTASVTEFRRGKLTFVSTNSKSAAVAASKTTIATTAPGTTTKRTPAIPPASSSSSSFVAMKDNDDDRYSPAVPTVTLESIAKTRTSRRKSTTTNDTPSLPPFPAGISSTTSSGTTATDNQLPPVSDNDYEDRLVPVSSSLPPSAKYTKGSTVFPSLKSDHAFPVLRFDDSKDTPTSTDGGNSATNVPLFSTAKTPLKTTKPTNHVLDTFDVINFSMTSDSMVSTDGFPLALSFDGFDGTDGDTLTVQTVIKAIQSSIDNIITKAAHEATTTKRRHLETLHHQIITKQPSTNANTKTLLTKYENVHQRIRTLAKSVTTEIDNGRNHIKTIQKYVTDIHQRVQDTTTETETLREKIVQSYRQQLATTTSTVRTVLKQEAHELEKQLHKTVTDHLTKKHAIYGVTQGLISNLEDLL